MFVLNTDQFFWQSDNFFLVRLFVVVLVAIECNALTFSKYNTNKINKGKI